MDSVYVKLFGIPSVSRNGSKVLLPSRKVEALFYYLAVNKEAGRDEVSGLLWPDADPGTGRKNLRNAIYYIKKSFEADIIISPKKSMMQLNPEIQLASDLETLLSGEEWTAAYTGDFLQGFVTKGEEAFEEWIRGCRDRYRSLYIQKLYGKIKQESADGNHTGMEQASKRLIEMDQYDEKAHRVLMKAYTDLGLYNRAVEVYGRLSEVLKADLGIIPDVKSRTLFNKILEIRNRRENSSVKADGAFFYGRKQELDRLRRFYSCFRAGKTFRSVVIIGEAGIGKTRLKDRFLEEIKTDENIILESSCYQAEEEVPLKAWSSVFSSLLEAIDREGAEIPGAWRNVMSGYFPAFATFNEKLEVNPLGSTEGLKLKLLEETVLNLLGKMAKTKKLIIVFDDIQWMDKLSVLLLSSVLLRLNGAVAVVAACRNSYTQKLDDFITEMSRYDRLCKIELERFSKAEAEAFIRAAMPESSLSEATYDRIYEETEGNTFFMVEYLNSLRENRAGDIQLSRMADILKSRFIGVSEEGQKILNLASVFYDEVPLDILSEISGMDKLKLLDIIDDLKLRYIVKEIKSASKTGLVFTHQKLREFIYSRLSDARKQVLHERIGEVLESRLAGDDGDIALYPRLVYHFTNGGNLAAALKYNIKNANYYLDFYHELFPVLSKGPELDNMHYYRDMMKYFQDIEEQLQKVRGASPPVEEMTMLEVAFYHMKGRYLIRQGEYEAGVGLIEQLTSTSLATGNTEYVLKGHRQMIYCGIQTRDLGLMKEHIGAGLAMAKDRDMDADVAMFLRLEGLYKIMNGEYEEAEELLKQCINRFLSLKASKDKYSMHIAAAYSYIGDIRRYGMRFKSSLEYYDRAISLCENSRVLTSLTIFCTNAGQAAFDAGDYVRARAYFAQALRNYSQADSIWGRGIAEGYTALLLIREGSYREALDCIKRADEYSCRLRNPYEKGLICRIKAEIRHSMDTNGSLQEVFSEYLDLGVTAYCGEAAELLKGVNDRYQLDILNIFANKH